MSRLLSILGRVAIVTGSSSGNGRAVALALASEGASVVCSDLDPSLRAGGFEKDSTPTHDLIVQNGGTATFQKADVSSVNDVQALIQRAVKHYGRLDIMVNNAGVFLGLNNIVDESVDAFDKTMAVNTRGTYLGTKFAVEQMMKQDPLPSGERGWIINMTSVGGQVGLVHEPAYCASKGAVLTLTKQVAIDYAPHKIHVNGIAPGMIETSMVRDWVDNKATKDYIHSVTPWPDFGQAEDVGNAALFLAGKAARFMTGTILNIDGGFTSK